MKNALILHGTNGSPTDNWFQWLGWELEKLGYKVWAPLLPQHNKPNIQRYNKFIFENKDFIFNKKTIIVGHSSGAVAILGLLQALPETTTVHSVYLVGSFKDDLGRNDLKELFLEPFDFEKIATKAGKFVFFHSDDDPICPLNHAEFLAHETGGELILLPDQKHFNIHTAGPKYRRFPELLMKIKESIA